VGRARKGTPSPYWLWRSVRRHRQGLGVVGTGGGGAELPSSVVISSFPPWSVPLGVGRSRACWTSGGRSPTCCPPRSPSPAALGHPATCACACWAGPRPLASKGGIAHEQHADATHPRIGAATRGAQHACSSSGRSALKGPTHSQGRRGAPTRPHPRSPSSSHGRGRATSTDVAPSGGHSDLPPSPDWLPCPNSAPGPVCPPSTSW